MFTTDSLSVTVAVLRAIVCWLVGTDTEGNSGWSSESY